MTYSQVVDPWIIVEAARSFEWHFYRPKERIAQYAYSNVSYPRWFAKTTNRTNWTEITEKEMPKGVLKKIKELK